MAPKEKSNTIITQSLQEDEKNILDEPTIAAPWKHEYIYVNIIYFIYTYAAGFYGGYLIFTSAKWWSVGLTTIYFYLATLGITAGAHRLFAHKSYKATIPLQYFLMLCHCLSYQRTLVTWVRDHRIHHKYSDTDADPHNSSRGFFFSHIGWILVKNHPELVKRRDQIDMSDVYSNPVLMFQKRHKRWLLSFIAFAVPTATLWILGESFSNSWHLNLFRLMLNSNLTFLTNSLAHSWGYRPYDKTMKACQNTPLLLMTMGDGFHNYHHAFPWDYRAAELGNNSINYITQTIDFFAKFGWAYDLKMVSDGMIRDRAKRTGDGTDLWARVINKVA